MTGLVTLIIVLLTAGMAISLMVMMLAIVWAVSVLRHGRWWPSDARRSLSWRRDTSPPTVRHDYAMRRGVSRSAWVAFTLSKALDEEEQA